MNKEQKTTDFWELKHRIDDELKRLGWTPEEHKAYIQEHYDKSCHFTMNNAQLNHLLCQLWYLGHDSGVEIVDAEDRRRRRRRRD